MCYILQLGVRDPMYTASCSCIKHFGENIIILRVRTLVRETFDVMVMVEAFNKLE